MQCNNNYNGQYTKIDAKDNNCFINGSNAKAKNFRYFLDNTKRRCVDEEY